MKLNLNLVFLWCAVTLVVGCKKDKVPSKELGGLNSVYLDDDDPGYTEDEMSAFLDDVVYFNTHDEELLVDAPIAINKMQASLNYVFSDVDTTFSDWDTAFDYPFTIIPNGNNELDMRDVSNAMYAVKAVIMDRLDDNIGSGLAPKLITLNITYLGSNAYNVDMQFGKADLANTTPAEHQANITGGPFVWRNTTCGPNDVCTTNTMATMMDEANPHLLAWLNLRVAQATTLFTKPYLDGMFLMSRTKTIGGSVYNGLPWVDWSDATSVSSTGIPDQLTGGYSFATTISPPGVKAPMQSAMFAKVRDGYLGDWSTIPCYEYCLTQAYLNFYVDRIVHVFDAVKPSSTNVALGGVKSSAVWGTSWPVTWNNYRFNISAGYTSGGAPSYATMTSDFKIYHQYYFQYSKMKTKTINWSWRRWF